MLPKDIFSLQKEFQTIFSSVYPPIVIVSIHCTTGGEESRAKGGGVGDITNKELYIIGLRPAVAYTGARYKWGSNGGFARMRM